MRVFVFRRCPTLPHGTCPKTTGKRTLAPRRRGREQVEHEGFSSDASDSSARACRENALFFEDEAESRSTGGFCLPNAVRLFRTACPRATGKRTLAPRRRGREQVEHEGFRLPRAVRLFRTGLVPRRRENALLLLEDEAESRSSRRVFVFRGLSDSSARLVLGRRENALLLLEDEAESRSSRRVFVFRRCPTLPHGTCPKTTGKRTLAPRRRGREQVEHEGFQSSEGCPTLPHGTCPRATGKRTLAPRRRGREQVEHEGFRLPRAVRLFRTGLVPRRRENALLLLEDEAESRSNTRVFVFRRCPTLPHGTCPKTTGKRTLAPRRRGREQVEHEGFSVFRTLSDSSEHFSENDGGTPSSSFAHKAWCGRRDLNPHGPKAKGF